MQKIILAEESNGFIAKYRKAKRSKTNELEKYISQYWSLLSKLEYMPSAHIAENYIYIGWCEVSICEQKKHNNGGCQTESEQVPSSKLLASSLKSAQASLVLVQLASLKNNEKWLQCKSPNEFQLWSRTTAKINNYDHKRTCYRRQSNSTYPTYLDDVLGTDGQPAERRIRPARQHRQWSRRRRRRRRRRWWWWCFGVVVIRQRQTISVDTSCLVRHHMITAGWYQGVPRHAHVVSTNVSHVHVCHASRWHVTEQQFYFYTMAINLLITKISSSTAFCCMTPWQISLWRLIW